MVVSDADISLTITGNGDVLEPYDGVIGMIQDILLNRVVLSILFRGIKGFKLWISDVLFNETFKLA